MKIRAVTAGVPLRWPLDQEAEGALRAAGAAAAAVRGRLADGGWEVQTTRLATPPLDRVLHGAPPETALELAQALEARAAAPGFEYLALGAIDTLASSSSAGSWQPLLEQVPEIIRQTNSIFCAATVATRNAGINLAATRTCGDLVAAIAAQSADGFGNLRFAALANCPPHIPFFPAAYHDGGGQATLGLALEAADLAVRAFGGATSLDDAGRRLTEALSWEVAGVTSSAQAALAGHEVTFTGVDLSLAPFPADDRSIASAFECLGLPAFGTSGTLFLASFLTQCLRQAAGGGWFGFSGLMLPVLEDSVLAERAAQGTLGVDSLLLYSSVCGLGLDTVPLPGDTPPGELGAIILDMAALALRLDKPLTARLFPVPGKRAGDRVSWDFAFFAPSRVLPVRGMAPGGLLAQAERYNPPL